MNFQSISHQDELVTPNRRLARLLTSQYDEQQAANARRAWMRPIILPYDTWLIERFQAEYPTDTRLLLSDIEVEHLFATLMAETCTDTLAPLPAAAAKEAYYLLKRFRIPFTHPRLQSYSESLQLLQWIEQYQTLCRKKNLIDISDLAEAIHPGKSTLHWVGFTEFTPEQQTLIARLNPLQHTLPTSHSHTQTILRCSQRKAEINALIAWAKKNYEAGLRVGCIVPDSAYCAELETAFIRAFDRTNPPFNIAGGKPLSDCPLFSTALTWLTFLDQPLPLATVSHLLRSPFILLAETHFIARMRGDALLREHTPLTYTYRDFYRLLQKILPLDPLTKALSNLTLIPKKQYPSEWANYFLTLLSTLGFPGERTLTSVEYQTLMRSYEVLKLLSRFDHLEGYVSYAHALSLLKKIAKKTLFQAERVRNDIQIVGALEATHLNFDVAWVIGAHDQIWPPVAKPNPFLPIALQCEYDLPHASYEREWRFTQELIKQLSLSASHLIYSYATEQDVYSISPLLRTLPEEIYHPPLRTTDNYAMEELATDSAPLLTDPDAPGGTRLFQQQALCPFRAFAYLRLHAKALPTAEYGISRQDRGRLLHSALDYFWQTIGTQKNLQSLTTAALQRHIEAAIERALSMTENNAFVTLEKIRLARLINTWCEIEKNRPPFTVIATEKTIIRQYAGMHFHIRLDRVDELQDESLCIIDYKTGKVSINDWYSDRPLEPQLPFYAVQDEKIKAIIFAVLQPAHTYCSGVSATETAIPGIKAIDDFETQRTTWSSTLTQLAENFKRGDARIDPKTITTCNTCDLQGLCRIHERQT